MELVGKLEFKAIHLEELIHVLEDLFQKALFEVICNSFFLQKLSFNIVTGGQKIFISILISSAERRKPIWASSFHFAIISPSTIIFTVPTCLYL